MSDAIDPKMELTLGLTLFIFGLATHYITKYGIFRVPSLWQMVIILAGLLVLSHAIISLVAANMGWLYLLVVLILVGGGLWIINSKYPLAELMFPQKTSPIIAPYAVCRQDSDCLQSPYTSSCCVNRDYENNITDIPSGKCEGYLPDMTCECIIGQDQEVGYCTNRTK